MPVFQAFSEQTPPTITPDKIPKMCLYCTEEKFILESTQKRVHKTGKEIKEHQEDIKSLQSEMKIIRSFIGRQVYTMIPFKIDPLAESEVTEAIFGTHTDDVGLRSPLVWPRPGTGALDETMERLHRRFDDQENDPWFNCQRCADLIKIFDNRTFREMILSLLQILQELDQKRLEAEKKLHHSKKEFRELNMELNKLWDRGFDDPVRRNIISWDNVYRPDVYPEVSEWPHYPVS